MHIFNTYLVVSSDKFKTQKHRCGEEQKLSNFASYGLILPTGSIMVILSLAYLADQGTLRQSH